MRLRKLMLMMSFSGLLAGGALAQPFTGPTSPYYLDNYSTGRIYVVQGTSVINSFAWAYGADADGASYNELTMAVSSMVNTRPYYIGTLGQGGQYTLSGTPTGVTEPYPTPAGESAEQSYDGASDGTHNYYVEYYGETASGSFTENVYQTGLTWQSPTELFSVQSAPGDAGEYLGSTYDPANNSLWISGWADDTIRDYSLSGTLLFSFSTTQCCQGALGYDPVDGTLWINFDATNLLKQYSTTGTLLQSGTPAGLPGGYYYAGDFSEIPASPVPEPLSLVLLATVVGALLYIRRRTTSGMS